MKTVAVMTSGGDAPGMNAAIRGVYGRAKEYGYRVLGIRNGYTGLLFRDIFELCYEDVEHIVRMGGTILGTARCEEFYTEEGQKKAADICREIGIDAVVVIGGDGSFKGALKLANQGIGVIGIPGTIDLDIACTEYTLGYDTAVNAAMEAIDRIADTSMAHRCYSVIEVMGHRAGYIAMSCGIATAAQKILIPERHTIDHLIEDLKRRNEQGGIIVLSEGVGKAEEAAALIEKELHIHTRANVLGFLQRGGNPTCWDRVCGCRMGAYAVDLFKRNCNRHVVAIKKGAITSEQIEKALLETREFPEELYRAGKTISEVH